MRITNQQIDDITDAALCGGIGYWAWNLDYGRKPSGPVSAMSEALTRGGTLTFEDEDGGKHELTKSNMRKGIELAVANTSASLDDFDSLDADCAVQYAVFGELVYG